MSKTRIIMLGQHENEYYKTGEEINKEIEVLEAEGYQYLDKTDLYLIFSKEENSA